MTDSALIVSARQWVIDKYPYNSTHLLKTLDWLDQIAPEATEALRLAALTHDMERAFPGPDQPMLQKIDGLEKEDEYNRLHAARSARIVGEWLHEQGADASLAGEVERLIIAHEVGGWPEADLVQAADSLSFLETNVDLFLGFARDGKRTLDEVAIKFFTTYHRIQVRAVQELALPLYKEARDRLWGIAWRPADAGYSDCYLTTFLLINDPNTVPNHIFANLELNVERISSTARIVENFFNPDNDLPVDRNLFSDSTIHAYMRIITSLTDDMTTFLNAATHYGTLYRRYVAQRESLLQ